MCQLNPPKNVETNDNMRLENYILHFDIARTSFDVNVNKKDDEETETQSSAFENRVSLCDKLTRFNFIPFGLDHNSPEYDDIESPQDKESIFAIVVLTAPIIDATLSDSSKVVHESCFCTLLLGSFAFLSNLTAPETGGLLNFFLQICHKVNAMISKPIVPTTLYIHMAFFLWLRSSFSSLYFFLISVIVHFSLRP